MGPDKRLRPRTKGFNIIWLLPILGGLAIAVLLVCAAGFAIWAIAFYEPEAPVSERSPTPTFSVVRFGEDGDEQQQVAETTPVPDQLQSAEESSTQSGNQSASETSNSSNESQGVFTGPIINEGPVTMTSPDYGMQVFLFWQEEIADRDLKLVEDAGFRWVKQEFAWREIEPVQKGDFDWSRTDRIMNQIDAHGLKVIIRLGVQPEWAGGGFPEVGPPDNLQDFADFATAVATRYKGRIDAYQIWNEPNLAREWGNRPPNAAEYTELLKVAYKAIKAVDPFPIVISAGMAPTTRNDDVARPDTYYVQEMYDAGAKPFFDALGAHGPGYSSPPETDPAEIARTPGLANPGDFKPENNVPEELRRVYGFRHVEDLRQIMVSNGDEDKQVVLLEFGWTIDPRPNSPYAWHAVTAVEQAQYFERAYAYAKENWKPWISVMSRIYIANPQWTMNYEQTYWSIVYPTYPELTAAPAYFGLKAMPKD